MNKNNKITIFKLSICLIIYMLFAPNTFATVELEEIADIPIEKNILREVNTNVIINKILQTSTNFDLRDHVEIEIKNQKGTQECWAFASNTALETNLALRENKKYNFSERHMVYSTSRTFTDGTNELGHNKEANGGGNESIAVAYWTSGRGPILEEEMPFEESEAKISLSEIRNKTVQKKVTDYVIFPTILKTKDKDENITYSSSDKTITYTEDEVTAIRNKIKAHIMEYGAVTSMTVSGNAYNDYYNYELDYPAFYCNNADLEPNHQISIIGWDDDYLVENFNETNRPSNPGAYLVLNSYGTEKYKYGCYYISYEDCFIECRSIRNFKC